MISDFRKCSVCGHEMSTYASKCSNCGANADVKRNSFVSFWLWLSVIINGFVTLGYIGWFAEIGFTWQPIMWLAGCAFILSGYIMLLRWNKMGFYILSGACVFSMVRIF